MRSLSVGLAILLAGCTLPGNEIEPAADPAFRTILPDENLEFSGQSSFSDARRDVLTSEEAWREWWEGHTVLRSRDGRADPPAIDVDFGRELLVAVTAGPQSSSCGEQIRITDAVATDDAIAVTVVTYTGGGSTCIHAQTHPVHVVALSPRASIRFVETSAEGRPPAPP